MTMPYSEQQEFYENYPSLDATSSLPAAELTWLPPPENLHCIPLPDKDGDAMYIQSLGETIVVSGGKWYRIPPIVSASPLLDSTQNQIANLEAQIAYLEPIAKAAQEPLNECIMLLTAIKHQTEHDYKIYASKAANLLDKLGIRE